MRELRKSEMFERKPRMIGRFERDAEHEAGAPNFAKQGRSGQFLLESSLEARTVLAHSQDDVFGEQLESSQGDYKEVGGVLIPHSIEVRAKGAPEGETVTIDKVELNVEIPAADFAMPEVKAAPPAEAKPEAKPPAVPAAR